jgi:hypothetical protein
MPSLGGISLSGHTLGAGLQCGQPPVVRVVHRIWLFESEPDRVGALLPFLGDYARASAFGDQHPGVVNPEGGIIDTPSDLTVWLEDIDRAPDRKVECLPVETHALREPGLAAVDLHVGRVGVPARPLGRVDQVRPDEFRRRVYPALIMDENIGILWLQALWPVDERRCLPQIIGGEATRFLRKCRRRGREQRQSGDQDQRITFHNKLHSIAGNNGLAVSGRERDA